MHFFANSVSTKLSYNADLIFFRDRLNGDTDVRYSIAEQSRANSLLKSFFSDREESASVIAYCADRNGPCRINKKTFVGKAEVKPYDISLLKGPLSRNAVHDFIIN